MALRDDFNNLKVQIFSTGTSPIIDVDRSLELARIIRMNKGFPGGLYLALEVYVPRDPFVTWQVRKGQRIVVRNGADICWEGEIVTIGDHFDQGETGNILIAVGYWARLLGRRGWEKRWADNRLTDDVWIYNTGQNGAEKSTVDRQNRLRHIPKGVAWGINEQVQLLYTMPTGETVKRVKLSYNLQEGAQAWELFLYNQLTSSTIWSVTASGTGVRDDTLGTPSQLVGLYFAARAGQTPTEDGTYFGQIDSEVSGANALVVYSETGGITPTSVVQNIRAKVTELAATNLLIGSNTFTLEPFISNGRESMTSILARVWAVGDGSFNSWAAYIVESDLSGLGDGKPVLAFAQYPALTDWDYAIRIGEENVIGPIDLMDDAENVINWVAVKYRDELSNRDVILTPDDNANLKDTTSITEFGERHLADPLDAGASNVTVALNYGRRFLAANKDPRYYVRGPIRVQDYIRGKGGREIPASLIGTGKRIKIENYASDRTPTVGAGLTFIMTSVDYDGQSQIASIGTGVPDSLAVMLAQRPFRRG